MIVAELEICHSRPIAPTRRVGLANRCLPVGPGPGLGGVLLAGIVANFVNAIDAEDRAALFSLLDDLENGLAIRQPAVRHRYQDDLVGLALSAQRLVNIEGRFEFEFNDELGLPVQLVLGALYAVQDADPADKEILLEAIKFAWIWEGPLDAVFMDRVLNRTGHDLNKLRDFDAWSDPIGWALGVLSLAADNGVPPKKAIQKRFRDLLREAHPDHGAGKVDAAGKIKALTDARDILISAA